jgi:hypothetical protein
MPRTYPDETLLLAPGIAVAGVPTGSKTDASSRLSPRQNLDRVRVGVDQRTPRFSGGQLKLERADQILLEQRRHEEIPIAMVVKENRHLISVVSLNRALTPVLGGDARPDR